MYVLPTVAISLGLAMMLNHKGKLMGFFRSLYYVPVITSYVVVIVVWQWFFDYDIGLFNSILGVLGFEKAPWLLDPQWAMPSLVLLSIWKNCGYTVLMFMAGLQTIDENLYEAAAIDGANAWQRFRYIILPSIKTIVTLNLILAVSGALSAFEMPYVITDGGFGTSTYFVLMNKIAHTNQKVGLASAMAVVLLALILLVTAVQKIVERRMDSDTPRRRKRRVQK